MIGPGLTLAGASVAGGEWLLGPRVGAQYGGALLWIAITSLACQYVYNVEASRYTLYTGESVLTGAFRIRPGPRVWFWLYLLMDLGALLPYQVASVATPVAAIYLARMPNPADPQEVQLLRLLTYAMLTLALLPLVFGGKVYNALKVLMTTKIVFVFGFLLFLAIFYSSWATWADILSGLFKVGTVPAAGGGTTNVLVALWHGQLAGGRSRGADHVHGVRRHRRRRRPAAGVDQQLHARAGLGHGQPGRRDPEPDRRPQDLAVARGRGVPRHRRGADAAGAAGCGTCGAISWRCGSRPRSSAWRCRPCCRSSTCRAARRPIRGSSPA